jgi:hypothetical protein
MRFTIICILLLSSNLCVSQNVWFKHLPGWHARNTMTFNDTILTCGMDLTVKNFGNKIETFLYWSTINGDSLGLKKIKLDSIENDETRSSVISYNYSSSVKINNTTQHFVNLRYGGKKSRAFLISLNKFIDSTYSLYEYTVDTFTTCINNKLFLDKLSVFFVPYFIVDKPLERTANTLIYKERNNKRVPIHEIKNSSSIKYETTCHLNNKKSNSTFFYILRYMTDYAGAPRLWQDYIIKMDTTGKELWRVAPSNRDSINPEGMQMVQKPNGNLLVSWCDYWYRAGKNPVGHPSEPQGNYHCTVWFAEIDSEGKVLWRKNIKPFLTKKIGRDSSHNLFHKKVATLKDGVLWTGNYSWKYNHSYLLKTDFNGNPIWYREYELYPSNSARQEFTPYDVTATSDGGYVLTGEYVSQAGNIFKDGCQLATIIKVDSFGCLEEGCQKDDTTIGIKTLVTNTVMSIKVYPNPTNKEVILEWENRNLTKDVKVTLVDVYGKIIMNKTWDSSQKALKLDLEGNSYGVYYIDVKDKNKIKETYKILLIK